MLDADRQADRGVENPYLLADVGWHAGVSHACRQAGKRLGAAQANRQLEDLQRVEEFESRGLAADNVERESGTRPRALPFEETAGRGVLVEAGQVVDFGHFGVVVEVTRYETRVCIGFFHADVLAFRVTG